MSVEIRLTVYGSLILAILKKTERIVYLNCHICKTSHSPNVPYGYLDFTEVNSGWQMNIHVSSMVTHRTHSKVPTKYSSLINLPIVRKYFFLAKYHTDSSTIDVAVLYLQTNYAWSGVLVPEGNSQKNQWSISVSIKGNVTTLTTIHCSVNRYKWYIPKMCSRAWSLNMCTSAQPLADEHHHLKRLFIKNCDRSINPFCFIFIKED